MGTLSLDFLLWMLLAFFIGCIIGCLVHSIFAGARANALAMAAAEAVPGPHRWTHSSVDVSGTRAPALPRLAEPAAPEPPAAQSRSSESASAPAPREQSRTPTGKPRPPQGLSAPPEGGGDNLQRISGVGVKIELTLHRLGIYRYEQISMWTADEIDWVDEHLKFHGRIAREQWIVQARLLAAGDEETFTRQFGTGGLKE